MSVPDDPAGVAVPTAAAVPPGAAGVTVVVGEPRPAPAAVAVPGDDAVVAVFERPKVDAPTVPASAASATAASPRTPALENGASLCRDGVRP